MRACRFTGRLAGRRYASSSVPAMVGIPKDGTAHATAAYLTWSEVNVVGRQRLEAIANTCKTTHYHELRFNIQAPKAVKPLKQAIAGVKTADEMAKALEETMFEARRIEEERERVQLSVWGLTDQINLGLNVHAPEKIEQFKKRLVEDKKKLEANRKKFKDYCAKHFDTESFNDVINVFRIAGERSETARMYAEMLLDDMTLTEVQFNEATKAMLKNIVFGDMPHEDSNLLFSFVENPERGEVSLKQISDGDLTGVADEAVYTIGRRHTTPVTDHVKLQQKDTHPMLQRSPE